MADQPEWSIEDRSGIQDDFLAAMRASGKPVPVRLPDQAPLAEEPCELPDVSLPAVFTNQDVINAFHDAALTLGLADRWALLERVEGLSLAELVKDRQGLYRGPDLTQLPQLTERERRLVHRELSEAVEQAPGAERSFRFEPGSWGGFLRSRSELRDHRVGAAERPPHQASGCQDPSRAPGRPGLEPLRLVSLAPG